MRSLSAKLSLAFLLVAITAAALVAASIRLTSPERLNRFLREQAHSELESLLVAYYAANGSFDGVQLALEAKGYLPALQDRRPDQDDGRPHQPGGVLDGGQPVPAAGRLAFALADQNGLLLVSLLPNLPAGRRAPEALVQQGEPVEIDGRTVGWVLTPGEDFALTPQELAYLERTNQALWLAALGAVTVALLVGVLLARSLSRPLRALTAAARRMAGGDLHQSVPAAGQDEIGELGRAFNQMSQAVSDANRQRRQMTADIAHDLRTPLTVISGYVESMQDGVLAPSPERLSLIQKEIERLQRMVEDLRTLAHADAGELGLYRQPCDPGALLRQCAASHQHTAERQQVTLRVEVAPDLAPVLVDEGRMAQVLDNLVSNALRYTPAGGSIRLAALPGQGGLLLTVQDSGAGIAPADLPHIFERFYRADKSRSEQDGASGLGLAIARAIVQAHGGKISAESQPGQGTLFKIWLPES
jgi:signal transduction histidine kinase